MKLSRMRRFGPGVVVKAAGQDVLLGSSSPTVRLGFGFGSAVPFAQLALLGTSEPEVVATQCGVDRSKIRLGEVRTVQVGIGNVVRYL